MSSAADSTTGTPKTIVPSATIGMVGSGQLGRMFAMRAMSMGYRVAVLASDRNDPAAQVASDVVVGNLNDREVVERFAMDCDVITLEFENIPAETIQWCSEHAPTHPSSHILAVAQDRLIEKGTMCEAGLPVAPFARVASAAEVSAFADTNGWPVILKTARSGYDGKGQHRLENEHDASAVPWDAADAWIAEKCIPFDREISVVVARSSSGEMKCFDPFENAHRNHILDVTNVPASISTAQRDEAIEIATAAAKYLDLVGVLCVEMFVVGDQQILINEIAPRPHNSGHLTIEACHTSQFEQHVRAVCGLPLGDAALRVEAAAMANLLGDIWQDGPPDWDGALQAGNASLHLYGKAEARNGRKMGHLTATAKDVSTAIHSVLAVRDVLERGTENES